MRTMVELQCQQLMGVTVAARKGSTAAHRLAIKTVACQTLMPPVTRPRAEVVAAEQKMTPDLQAPPIVAISQACRATATMVAMAAGKVVMTTRTATPRAGGAGEVVAVAKKSRAMEVAEVVVVAGTVVEAAAAAATDLAAAVALGLSRRLIR
jgi:hypothetical protein